MTNDTTQTPDPPLSVRDQVALACLPMIYAQWMTKGQDFHVAEAFNYADAFLSYRKGL
jgi:hypothetical protein